MSGMGLAFQEKAFPCMFSLIFHPNATCMADFIFYIISVNFFY